jgi:hypothetical protein
VSLGDPLFLDVDDVLEIHATQLETYGGGADLRDGGLRQEHVRGAFFQEA